VDGLLSSHGIATRSLQESVRSREQENVVVTQKLRSALLEIQRMREEQKNKEETVQAALQALQLTLVNYSSTSSSTPVRRNPIVDVNRELDALKSKSPRRQAASSKQ
jgi:hypothetical protein